MRRTLLARKGNRGSVVRESRVWGGGAVALIIKHNGEKQTQAKQKEGLFAGIETPEARRQAVDVAAGILFEQPGRNPQCVKRGREWAERQSSA